MWCITVERLKNLVKERNIDVPVVDVASIFKSTQYQREMFLIQRVVRRGKKIHKDCNGTPNPDPMWK
jgi:hypothetical protein